MPEQRIEKVIHDVLAGDAQRNALAFTAYLQANKMVFERAQNGYWKDKPYWQIRYRDAPVCFIFIHGSPARYSDEPEGWIVWTDDSGSDCYAKDSLDKQTREIAWEHVDECAKCSPNSPCFGGRAQTLFGKTIDHVCRTQMIFINPDVEALQCLKKLVAIRQEDILSNDPNSMNMG